MKYIPSNPANKTPLSSETEMRCNLANSASNGLPSVVASIEPICTRSAAIFGLTACCDTTVNPIISMTHNTTGLTSAGRDRTRPTRATSSTTPHTTPITCIHHSPYPTIAPAWSRLAKIRNAPGATTKLKNTSLPSHKLNARNSTVRKNVLIAPLTNSGSRMTSKNLRRQRWRNLERQAVVSNRATRKPMLKFRWSTVSMWLLVIFLITYSYAFIMATTTDSKQYE
jgi:hypothetical protein